MDNKLVRFQNSPINRRAFLLKGGKLFSMSVFMAILPLKSFFNFDETLFWLKFNVLQRIDTFFFSMMGKVTRRFDNFFD